MKDNFKETNGTLIQGHIKTSLITSGEVLIDKRNAIHYENMSIPLAESLSNAGEGSIPPKWHLVMAAQVLTLQV